MITEKEYLEAQMIIKLYESQQLNIAGVIGSSGKAIPEAPKPPQDRTWREGGYDKLKKHLNFCIKYPETVIGANDSTLMVQYMIDNGIKPVLEGFKVGRMYEFYKMDSNVFLRFKDIIKDWNDII